MGLIRRERKQKYGNKARDMLNRLVGEKIVTLYIFGGMNKYKREVAKVVHDDRYFNPFMIRLGYVWYC